MAKQFQYTRLAYQETAVKSLASVFNEVKFYLAQRSEMNPTFMLDESRNQLEANIKAIRTENHVSAGATIATDDTALNLDVLMETGTGKTFTFIETMYKLHKDKGLAKFIILVPSNPIRQGTLKSLASTAVFFGKAYEEQKISVFNYSPRTVDAFIHNANAGISVLVATYQSFNKDKNTINKRGVEANLFSRAKSYMEALAAIRPVIIIDEPHRFEGAQTLKYLAKFNPLLTIRFGATFKNDEYQNLVYTLDSVDAFNQKLVKSITVDEAGDVGLADYAMSFSSVSGLTGDKSAQINYKKLDGKSAIVNLKTKDNLGEKTGIHYLAGYIVENIAAKEVVFTNGFTLSLGEQSSYGMLADDIQRIIIQTTIRNHFEREEMLFKRGLKALSLFFIDSVPKYMPGGNKPAVVRDWFEVAYKAELEIVLAKNGLDIDYRKYLERTQNKVSEVHKGYFSKSRSEKSEEEAIKLILEEKEKLLSFDTDLRFIFSMWALQEGWDNPNIFTLCKLAPSNSKITKLQQIGRGLRLAVNQSLVRLASDDVDFEEVNKLVVVVPAIEKDFAESIQKEIAEHSVNKTPKSFNDAVLVAFGIASNTRTANKVLDALVSSNIITLVELTGEAVVIVERDYINENKVSIMQSIALIQGADANKMVDYLEKSFGIKVNRKSDAPTEKLTINPSQYAKFKHLWENLNRNAVLKYDLNTPMLIENILAEIKSGFDVKPISTTITTTTNVESLNLARSTQATYEVTAHSMYSIGEFIRELANNTKLSYSTIAQILKKMPADKFVMIAKNENRALSALKDICIWSIYDLIINKITYELSEVRVQTSITDNTGALLESIPLTSCGKELFKITNAEVREKSLFNEAYFGVDSKIEKDTIDESQINKITVFAKLPRVKIPTPLGDYNPDFGYVVVQNNETSLYLVVETKGYDSNTDIGKSEEYKITSAKQFFNALKLNGIDVSFQTKMNQDTLASIISAI